MSRPADFNIHTVIEGLQGTTNTIQDHLPEGMDESDLTSADYDVIDNEIFLCPTCGWWCEISEQADTGADEPECQDCRLEDEEE